ncbi:MULTISPECIES: hypothetical protein [Saccharothrix]|uniref:hypothetical protein n=1 Tax=Saccharothrix TaxID=2071 RepID=UPI00093FAC67|nr:hypothetical protein [Saccharothrix sp. CB00851]OKI29014.1 hypothetical protein A6A25_30105 [Saccharothrix sp. CB00851]
MDDLPLHPSAEELLDPGLTAPARPEHGTAAELADRIGLTDLTACCRSARCAPGGWDEPHLVVDSATEPSEAVLRRVLDHCRSSR